MKQSSPRVTATCRIQAEMRVVIDTNILISALLSATSLPARLIGLWRHGDFDFLSADEQIRELMRVTRYPKIRERLAPALAGRLINEVRDLSIMVENLPLVTISPDPFDNYLLAIAAGGRADYVITGDKRDLLVFDVFEGAKIVTVRDFLASR
jgi:putative PIN family toxin of toxin-antitoxin system